MSDGRLLRKLRAHTEPVWALSFSAEGNQLASASADCSVAIWDAAAAASDAPVDEPTDGGGSGRRGDGGGDGVGVDAGRAQARRVTVVPPSPFLLRRLHTKSTPVVAAHYTRTNVLMAVGAFRVAARAGRRRRVARNG